MARFSSGRQEGVVEAGLGEMHEFSRREAHAMRMAVFVAHGGFEHGWDRRSKA